MDDKIVEIKNTLEVCDNLVELVEDILEDVKKGVIVAGAFVVVQSDNTTGNAFAGGHPIQILAESLILQRNVMDCEVNLRLRDAGTYY